MRAAEHFRLHVYAAATTVLAQAAVHAGSLAAALEQFPFLAGYHEALAARGVDLDDPIGWWSAELDAFEAITPDHLPLRALAHAAGLDHRALILLVAIGLPDEDARFGALLDAAHGNRRPTVGLLHAWWHAPLDPDATRAHVRRLRELGVVQVANPDAPRLDWVLQVPEAIWEAARGGPPTGALRHRPRAALPEPGALILDDELRATLARAQPLVASGQVRTVVIRGPRHTGRHTVAGLLARLLGHGVLEVELRAGDRERWAQLGVLATLLDAAPVVALDIAPGESLELPMPPACAAPLVILLGRHGALRGPVVEAALTLPLGIPEPAERRRHWQRALASTDCAELAERFRLGAGAIAKVARLARLEAEVAGHPHVTAGDVLIAARALRPANIDALATRLPAHGDWSRLAVAPELQAELRSLELRCRHRERMRGHVGAALGAQLNAGVRALFTGPSGTGKTLAARVLAAVLHKDLYRIDLSAVVNKYIGETEKNLDQAFALAEELDVVLLFDEGDALMTQRTNVASANDRYANLETNFLLQRIETFDGILIVTTNAADAIDGAFQRRMDQVVDFRRPEAAERWAIWQLHLPAVHAVDAGLLRELASRCALSGGQIRNAVLHATLLAIDDGGTLTTAHVEAAVLREYRKSGGVCPLRRARA